MKLIVPQLGSTSRFTLYIELSFRAHFADTLSSNFGGPGYRRDTRKRDTEGTFHLILYTVVCVCVCVCVYVCVYEYECARGQAHLGRIPLMGQATLDVASVFNVGKSERVGICLGSGLLV